MFYIKHLRGRNGQILKCRNPAAFPYYNEASLPSTPPMILILPFALTSVQNRFTTADGQTRDVPYERNNQIAMTKE